MLTTLNGRVHDLANSIFQVTHTGTRWGVTGPWLDRGASVSMSFETRGAAENARDIAERVLRGLLGVPSADELADETAEEPERFDEFTGPMEVRP